MCHWLGRLKIEVERPADTQRHSSLSLCLVGKNWDFTAALSDFEQLRQVHAGNLTYSFAEDRTYLSTEKEMARVGRPVLHRQDEVVQGKMVWTLSLYKTVRLGLQAGTVCLCP